MEFFEALKISSGVTAVIGSGGKTTLLRTLGEELSAAGRTVVLCTTTHIFPFAGLENLISPTEETLRRALETHGPVCAGTPEASTGKLTAPSLPMARLAELADVVLVEADGARGLPLKAHGPGEPVIPPEAGRTVCVLGLSGLGLPVAVAAHRPEVYARLAGTGECDPVTPELAARVLNREALADVYLLNQADTPERWGWSRRLAEALDGPAVIASLKKGEVLKC